MKPPAMIPIDDTAKDGAFHLVEAEDGTFHCARWDGAGWAYSLSAPVQKPIVRYSPRPASAARPAKAN